jgi:hypothetical protein
MAIRPRGYVNDWKFRGARTALMEQINAVFEEYAAYRPLTVRQIFYRLIGEYGYPKDKRSIGRLTELLIIARRAREIPFEWIRDDGVVGREPHGYPSMLGFWSAVRGAADGYRRVRQEGQDPYVEIICEAAGMVPQLEAAAHEYGIPVYSSGGANSLTDKWQIAQRAIERIERDEQVLTVILHVGDHDKAGLDIYNVLEEDVRAFVDGHDWGEYASVPLDADHYGLVPVRFERVAVTPEQIDRFGLEADPLSNAVQAEALAPDDMANELRAAILPHVNMDVRKKLLAIEAAERGELSRDVRKLAD